MSAPHRLLVAFDFSEPSKRALAFARQLRTQLHCGVDVVHVYLDPFAEMKKPPRESIWATPEQRDAHIKAVGEEVQHEVEKVFGPETQAVPIHVTHGDPGTEILRIANESGTDLVCTASTGKGGVERTLLGSVSTHLVRHSPVPVLTVH
jgi:nucleotide-binding universal stress UspA family protein